MKKYFKNTWKNKLISIALLLVASPTLFITGDSPSGGADCTAFVFILFFAIPLFFVNENWITLGNDEKGGVDK